MKKIIIITLAVLALFTSCNLDTQGIFAEVTERNPSDNRKLSVIGLNDNDNSLYFSSVNGIESFDIVTQKYRTLDDSEDARKNSIVFMLDDGSIIYGVSKATQEMVDFTDYYLCNPAGPQTVKLTKPESLEPFNGSFGKYAYDAKGNIYKADLTDQTLSFIHVCSVEGSESKRFVTRMENIFVFTTDMSSITPETKTLVYYLFDEDEENLKAISGLDDPGTIRSVAMDGSGDIIAVFSADTSKAYRISISDTSASQIGTVVSSKISRNFASFVKDDILYYVFDKASAFYRMNLSVGTTSSNTISKISNVSIVGYYEIPDTGSYRVCTSNNGFFTLSIDGDGNVSIN